MCEPSAPLTLMGPSTIASWAALIARTLEERGRDAGAILREAHLWPEQLGDPNARYPVAAMQRLWQLSVEATGDPCFGLDVGRSWRPTTFHALGYTALASTTLREALEYLVRYCHVVSTGVELSWSEAESEGHLRVVSILPDTKASPAARAALQAGLAAIVELLRQVHGEGLELLRVTLTQDEGESGARLEAYFRCPVVFSASENGVVLGLHDLDRPLPTANRTLLRVNGQALKEYAARLDAQELTPRVRSHIVRRLASGNVRQVTVARALNVSVRTLQRKLREEGISFQQLRDATRRDLAEEYTTDSTLAVAEIAYLLGFSDTSSMSRARRRWRDRIPSRASAAAEDVSSA
jgi:AraC-like DNA-binding protein